MNSDFHALPITDQPITKRIVDPEPSHQVSIDDPATSVLIDFQDRPPMCIQGDLAINAARKLMKDADVPFNLVVNGVGDFIGLISMKDILGKKALAKAHAMAVGLDEVQVRDIMQPSHQFSGIHIRHLSNVKVGDVVETFNLANAEYFLIVQNDADNPGATSLRGILSSAHVSRLLNISLDSSNRARSFSDIVHAVHGHFE